VGDNAASQEYFKIREYPQGREAALSSNKPVPYFRKYLMEALIKSGCVAQCAGFSAGEGKKSQEYWMYFKIF